MDVYTVTKLLGGKMFGTEGRSICPVCQKPKHKNPSLTISQGRNGKTLVHCHKGCDFKDVWEFIQGYSPSQIGRFAGQNDNVDFKVTYPEPINYSSQFTVKYSEPEVVEQKVIINNTPYAQAEYIKAKSDLDALRKYLATRSIELYSKPDIRFNNSCRAPDHTYHPALIAPMRKFGSDEVQSIHRTYLEPTSDDRYTKRQSGINKAMLGSTSGCHAMISKGNERSKWLIVTEGIENAFAIDNMKNDELLNDLVDWPHGDDLHHATVIAATSASNMGNLELPELYKEHFTHVYIWGDNDEVGTQAAHKLAQKGLKLGYDIVIHNTESEEHNDANDALVAAKKVWNDVKFKQDGGVLFDV